MREERNGVEIIQRLPVSSTSGGALAPLGPGSLDLTAEMSQSVNSINECGNTLLSMMKSLEASNIDHMPTAAELAKQVVAAARAKLEILRSMKK